VSRKLIRPSLTTAVRPQRGVKRPVPPEGTHAEAGYLLQAIESGCSFAVRLLGGQELRGRLESYDRDALSLRAPSGQVLLLRKSHVACYWMER
jgi:hypothetical protein